MKLDLACGYRCREGFEGVDLSRYPGVVHVWDLREMPWPWASESVDEIHSQHFFEHLDGKQRMRFMDETWRVLKMGGKASILTPYWTSHRAIMDPTHVWPPISEQSYLYFNRKWREDMLVAHYLPIKCNFGFDYGFIYAAEHQGEMQDADQKKVEWARRQIGIIDDLMVWLTKEP